MKLVKGIVRTDKIDEIAHALEGAGMSGFTVTEVLGHGANSGTALYRGLSYVALQPMSMIDVIAPDDSADEVVRILVDHGRTGQVGDGHVLVMTIEERYAVRTGWRHVA
jgi:nitrogen regulatory protein PII